MEKETILIGLSGGVDSAVCSVLLKRQGYEFVTVRDLFKKSGVRPERNMIYSDVD